MTVKKTLLMYDSSPFPASLVNPLKIDVLQLFDYLGFVHYDVTAPQLKWSNIKTNHTRALK